MHIGQNENQVDAHLITKADDRDDCENIGPNFRLVFDRPWCVPSPNILHHNKEDNVEYRQNTYREQNRQISVIDSVPAIETYWRKSIVLE